MDPNFPAPKGGVLTDALGRRAKPRHILSRVSEEFHDIITSFESLRIRSRLARDEIVMEFKAPDLQYYKVQRAGDMDAFSPKTNLTTMLPGEMFFTDSIGGLVVFACGSESVPTQVWVNKETGSCTQAKMPINVRFSSAGIFQGKFFIMGRKIQAANHCYQSFDIDREIWETFDIDFEPSSSLSVSIGSKIVMLGRASPIVFDPMNGLSTEFHMPSGVWTDACVICEKLFVYYQERGLMVFDKAWKVLDCSGTSLPNQSKVRLVEYNGILGALWIANNDEGDDNTVCMTSIGLLEETGVVKGTIGPIMELGSVPKTYELTKLFSILV